MLLPRLPHLWLHAAGPVSRLAVVLGLGMVYTVFLAYVTCLELSAFDKFFLALLAALFVTASGACLDPGFTDDVSSASGSLWLSWREIAGYCSASFWNSMRFQMVSAVVTSWSLTGFSLAGVLFYTAENAA